MRVHHFTATLSPRDAVGYHTLAVNELLGEMGHEVTLYAASVHPELRGVARDYRDHDADPRPDALLYQASIGSPVADHLLTRREPLILNYHNLTPAELFDPWEPHVGAELDAGRRQLARLARRAICGLAVSQYNASELVALGMTDVRVAPVLFEPPPVAPGSRLTGEPPTILFVGRLAPNKCQHDLVAAIAELRTIHPDARLVLVGTAASARYESALHELVERADPDSVVFAGSVSQAELVGWYRRADVFVCLSEHEGFCVPMVEAMAAGVPVVAYAAAAVPETLAGAGIVLPDKAPATVAAALERVLDDDGLRAAMLAAGRERAAHFSPTRSTAVNRSVLAGIIDDHSLGRSEP